MANEQAVAEWWRKGTHAKGDVTAHTPDPAQYHFADPNQSMKMGTGGSGAVIIPRANADGGSKGFDASQPGVVIVDPDAPEGGVTVDMSQITEEVMAQAMQGTEPGHEAYYKLGKLSGPFKSLPPPTPTTEAAAGSVNPVMPGYVTPRSNTDGSQVAEQPGNQQLNFERRPPQPSAPAHEQPGQVKEAVAPGPAPLTPVKEPAPAAGMNTLEPPPPAMPPAPAPPVIDMSQIQSMIATAVHESVSALASTLRPQSVVMPPEPAPAPAPAPAPVEDHPEEAKPVADPLESLQIDFLTDATPRKPQTQVMFDFEDAGGMSSFYHAVVYGNGCVILVYDTRYKEGQQFLPPNRGQKVFTLTVPAREESYKVTSMGFHFTFGVFDVVVLIEFAEPEEEVILQKPEGAMHGDEQEG